MNVQLFCVLCLFETGCAGQCLTQCINHWPLGGVLLMSREGSTRWCVVKQGRPSDLMHWTCSIPQVETEACSLVTIVADRLTSAACSSPSCCCLHAVFVSIDWRPYAQRSCPTGSLLLGRCVIPCSSVHAGH